MLGTNRDLTTMQELLDFEILRFNAMAKGAPEQAWIRHRLVRLTRQRITLCAALVNRRAEAAKNVVDFSRWVSGNGALGKRNVRQDRDGTPAEVSWRRRNPM